MASRVPVLIQKNLASRPWLQATGFNNFNFTFVICQLSLCVEQAVSARPLHARACLCGASQCNSELVEGFSYPPSSIYGVSLTDTYMPFATLISFIKASSFWEHAEHEVDNLMANI